MIALVVQWQFSKPKPKPKPRFFPAIPTETDRVLTIQNRYNTKVLPPHLTLRGRSWINGDAAVRLHEIYIALARFIQCRLSFTVGDSVPAFWVTLCANDLNCVDALLNPTHSPTDSVLNTKRWSYNAHSCAAKPVDKLLATVSCLEVCRLSPCPRADPTWCRRARSALLDNDGSPLETTEHNRTAVSTGSFSVSFLSYKRNLCTWTDLLCTLHYPVGQKNCSINFVRRDLSSKTLAKNHQIWYYINYNISQYFCRKLYTNTWFKSNTIATS